jgi:hypothetical protein
MLRPVGGDKLLDCVPVIVAGVDILEEESQAIRVVVADSN